MAICCFLCSHSVLMMRAVLHTKAHGEELLRPQDMICITEQQAREAGFTVVFFTASADVQLK